MYKKTIETTIRTLYDKIKDEEVEKLKEEIINLKAEIAALKENKIYTKTIDSYEKVENKTIFFSQEELEKYLKCMYTNIFQTDYSIGHNKIIEKTGLDKGVARAIKTKLVEDGIVKVEKYRTKVIKYLPDHKEVTETKTIEELRKDRKKQKLKNTTDEN